MHVSNLKLHQFRNYEQAAITFSDGMNVITGDNAQGKTNLLESLVYLSLTRSFRINNERRLIKDGCEYADIRCTLHENNEEKVLRALITPKGKTLLIDGNAMKKSSDFIGILNVILFSPDDLGWFTASPMDHRRLLSQEIAKISHKYMHALYSYQSLLKQRNIVLKQERVDETFLDTLDEEMAAQEAVIIRARRYFTSQINQNLGSLFHTLSKENHQVQAVYACCMDGNADRQDIQNMHKENRLKDRQYQTTTAGIHREDFTFDLDGRRAIDAASQGQKRMILLAYKMALHACIENNTGRNAIYLLDDVLSELDLTRQQTLLEMIRGSQCILTATSIPAFLKTDHMKEYRIKAGTITEMEAL